LQLVCYFGLFVTAAIKQTAKRGDMRRGLHQTFTESNDYRVLHAIVVLRLNRKRGLQSFLPFG
jgi:hypothetical protein